jgi:hypothetical protein
MKWRFTNPAKEQQPPPAITGDATIGAISIVLTDSTVITLSRQYNNFRASVVRSGTSERRAVSESTSIPGIGMSISDLLDELKLEPQSRATLYTIFTLRSLLYEGNAQREASIQAP